MPGTLMVALSMQGNAVRGGRRLFMLVRLLVAVVVTIQALLGVVRLTAPAVAGPTGQPPGVVRQLTFLRSALDGGAAERAQRTFPEGYFFLQALYGLAWVEVGMRQPDAAQARALQEARWALAKLDSPAGRAPFDAGLAPSYGIFYRGWTNWLRGGVLALQPAAQRDQDELGRFAEDSAAIATAFDAAASPYLAAYPGQAWPVDSTVAVASLRLHDHLLPAKFGGTVRRWLVAVRQRLDPVTGLLPHRVDMASGRPIEVARGSSQSVIERFLVDIDLGFAREQYLRFRDQFVTSPLGLGPAVREYPVGTSGGADVDSGPLIMGLSLSATVVTIGAAQVERDARLAGALANYGELAGIPIETPHSKRYVFGLAPIGDAFLAWSKTARPWVVKVSDPPPASISAWWRTPLLALLMITAATPWVAAGLWRRLSHPARRERTARPPEDEGTDNEDTADLSS